MRLLWMSILSVGVLWFAAPALAGNWGENWGSMIWGSIAAVPTMGWLGGALLVGLLVGVGMRHMGGRAGAALGLLLALGYAPVAEAETVSVPNTLTNGSVAEADAMNENFQALASAVNASDCATAADVVCNTSCPACPSCPACDTLGSFNQGAASVDITADNAAVAAAAAAAVDITTDNETLCTNAGGTYNAGANSCSVDITTDNAAVAAAAGNAACTQVGGTWEAGTSTCIAASSYNCFLGGFCAQAAIEFPPAQYDYTNVYAGDTQGAGAALAAGCDELPGEDEWIDGDSCAQELICGATVAHFSICGGN